MRSALPRETESRDPRQRCSDAPLWILREKCTRVRLELLGADEIPLALGATFCDQCPLRLRAGDGGVLCCVLRLRLRTRFCNLRATRFRGRPLAGTALRRSRTGRSYFLLLCALCLTLRLVLSRLRGLFCMPRLRPRLFRGLGGLFGLGLLYSRDGGLVLCFASLREGINGNRGHNCESEQSSAEDDQQLSLPAFVSETLLRQPAVRLESAAPREHGTGENVVEDLVPRRCRSLPRASSDDARSR